MHAHKCNCWASENTWTCMPHLTLIQAEYIHRLICTRIVLLHVKIQCGRRKNTLPGWVASGTREHRNGGTCKDLNRDFSNSPTQNEEATTLWPHVHHMSWGPTGNANSLIIWHVSPFFSNRDVAAWTSTVDQRLCCVFSIRFDLFYV